MVEHCLACGHKKIDYRSIMAGVYFVGAWIFAIGVMMLISQNKII